MFSTISRVFLLSRRELAALTIVFVVSLPAVTPRLYSSDEVQYFSYLRSLWFDRDVSFENEYRYFNDRDMAGTPGFRETFLERYTPVGRRINFGTIGSAILWAPFYAVSDVVVRASGAAPADGFSKAYVRAVAYGSAFYGFLAVLLSIRAARRVLGTHPPDLTAFAEATASPPERSARRRKAGPARRDGGVFAGVVVGVGTPLLFYMYIAPPFSHACSAFAVAMFLTVWLHVRRTWSLRGALALGLAGALMTMVREQDVFFAIGPALDFVLSAPARPIRTTLSAALAGTTAFLIGLAPQLLAYNALNGRPGPSQLVTRKMLWHAPHALKVLGSPEHGFLVWTPLAIVAIVGLGVLAVRGAGEAPRVAWISLLMVALQVYVNGSVDSWSAAGAFGHRRFVALTILLVIGIAALWQLVIAGDAGRARRKGRAYAMLVLIALCVWWNVALIALFGTRMMDRQRIELGRNAYDAFVTLPMRAPSLLYRYAVNRESFYRSPAPEAP